MILNISLAKLSIAILIFCLFIALENSVAQPIEAQSGFTDHPLLGGFSESEIIDKELQRDVNYRIVLGGLQRTRGEVIPEDSERLRGDVTKITYEVSPGLTGEDVNQFFREQLETRDYALLFSCEGRACGSSNYWANDIFRNRILYGPERNQFYMAFRANSGLENPPYFTLYIITRANRKIYAHLEIIEPGGTLYPEQQAVPVIISQSDSPLEDAAQNEITEVQVERLLQQLLRQGSVILPPLDFQAGDQLIEDIDISFLVSLLNSNQNLSVYLVSHLSEDSQDLQTLMQRSNNRARNLRTALINEGVDADRIIAAGVGPLAPQCAVSSCEQRLELVLR